ISLSMNVASLGDGWSNVTQRSYPHTPPNTIRASWLIFSPPGKYYSYSGMARLREEVNLDDAANIFSRRANDQPNR
ncbi:MAG: hypothetical protein ACR2RE_23405, partial [Geminicoccaceae bacterium]